MSRKAVVLRVEPALVRKSFVGRVDLKVALHSEREVKLVWADVGQTGCGGSTDGGRLAWRLQA